MKRKCNLGDEQQWLPEALAIAERFLMKSNVLVSSAKLITHYVGGQKKGEWFRIFHVIDLLMGKGGGDGERAREIERKRERERKKRERERERERETEREGKRERNRDRRKEREREREREGKRERERNRERGKERERERTLRPVLFKRLTISVRCCLSPPVSRNTIIFDTLIKNMSTDINPHRH